MNTTVILDYFGAVFGVIMALIVAWYERRSVARWFFAGGMVLLAMECIFSALTAKAASTDIMVYWQSWRLVAMSFLPGIWLLFSLSFGRGNYHTFLKSWRYVLIAAFLIPVGLALFFRDQLIFSTSQSSEGSRYTFRLDASGMVLNILFLISAVLVLMNLERTFRASVGTIRWRIKFMLLGVGVLFAVRAYVSSQALLFRAIDLPLQAANVGALYVACLLILLSVFRTGNFEVNVYPSQSVLQHSFTVLLAGVYLLIVGLLAKIVAFLGGDASFALKTFLVLVSLVLLAILLLSERVRLQTKRFVSRHFQRPLYDYRSIWRSFIEGTASCVEQTELCRATVKLVTDVFQVLSATIWLVDDTGEKLVFAASTSLSNAKGNDLTPRNSDAIEVIQALRSQTGPVDIDASTENWAAVVRRCNPDEFRKGGSRIYVPLIASGDVLGFMILGDRVSGMAFLQQDYDLLKCIGDEVGAGLLNVRLSEKLLNTKELEAFQNLSAFFVHDLKNTASTLNLMLKNLPDHFDNPEFRADALRGISKIVSHINNLISQLSLVRRELKIQIVESDLNEVVAQCISGFDKTAAVELVQELAPLPKVALDQEQIAKVITNLVINAKEATSQNGKIRVATSQNNGWAVLTVEDNGCGMSPEFLGHSLFRPFKSTKKNGLGIGMFQSKMIVVAHGGRLEASSELGKGTTFRMLLPLKRKI